MYFNLSPSTYIYWNLGSVNGMTRMSSATTIQEAVSSVNWELNLKPGLWQASPQTCLDCLLVDSQTPSSQAFSF